MKIKTIVFGDGLLGSAFAHYPNTLVLSKDQCDITQSNSIRAALNRYNPTVVINCAGVVPKANAPVEYVFKVNSFAPHYIADECYKRCKLVHISTDCVFSGERGNYTEDDNPDATDIYGMSKILGEPENSLVIRTSFVGLPDSKGRGLFYWASQQPELIGYDKVFWNGTTTLELAYKIRELVEQDITGIRHIYSYSISKHELLKLALEVFGWNIPLKKESEITTSPHVINKTLNSIHTTGFISKPVKQQLEELRDYVRQRPTK